MSASPLLLRVLLPAAILLGSSSTASAADYTVSYNPYATVDWGTTLRCQSQHHDHASTFERIIFLEFAGYCAVPYMTYSGAYRASTLDEWTAAGSPNPDPGKPVGWGPPRRWPPADFGAPVLPFPNLKLYLPAAEDVGLYANGAFSSHIESMFMTTYIEGAGCLACGVGGIPVARNTLGLPPTQIYSTDQELIDRIVENGGHATINHPAGPPESFMSLGGFGSIEMFNNSLRNSDDFAGTSAASDQMMATWDYLLQHKSPRIWGIASNDWFSAWTSLGQTYGGASLPVTARTRDRGKLQVLLTSYDLASYRAAFEAGAFFAVVEDNAVKNLYPTVTDIAVTYNSIAISTALGTETIRWIGNGSVVGNAATLRLDGLPDGLVYVRAEINDADGRTVYTQPFSLGDPPPPPAPPVPSMRVGALATLALLLLLTVLGRLGAYQSDTT